MQREAQPSTSASVRVVPARQWPVDEIALKLPLPSAGLIARRCLQCGSPGAQAVPFRFRKFDPRIVPITSVDAVVSLCSLCDARQRTAVRNLRLTRVGQYAFYLACLAGMMGFVATQPAGEVNIFALMFVFMLPVIAAKAWPHQWIIRRFGVISAVRGDDGLVVFGSPSWRGVLTDELPDALYHGEIKWRVSR